MLQWPVAVGAVTALLLSVTAAVAQVPPPVPVPTPQFNPSTPLVIPSAPEVPVSPGYGNGIGGSGADLPTAKLINRRPAQFILFDHRARPRRERAHQA